MEKKYSNLTKEELINKLIYLEEKLNNESQRDEETYISSFSLIFDYFPYPVIYLDTDFNIIYYNALFNDFSTLIYKVFPKRGENLKNLFENEKIEYKKENINKALLGEVVNVFETNVINNKKYYFQKIFIPHINNHGTISGILVTIIDITENETINQLSLEKINITEKLLNSLNCMIFTIDWDTKKFLYSNEYFNFVNGDVENKYYNEIFENDDLNLLKYEEEDIPYMSFDVDSNKFYSKELFITKYNRWFQAIYKPFRWLDGNLAVNILLFDINKYQEQSENSSRLLEELKNLLDTQTKTYQKLKEDFKLEKKAREDAEIELRLAKEQLTLNLKRERELSKLKSHILDNLSHEINTPLTIITSSIYLIKMYLKNGNTNEIIKHLDQIEKSALNMSDFTKATQDIYRARFGLNPVSLSIQNIISNIEEVLSSFESILKSNKILNRFYQSNIILYETDFNLFKQIIHQFLSNAFKYTKDDGIISIKVTEDEDKIIVSVIDNGIGIKKEDQDLIFDLFYRSKDTIGLFEGTGVGLAIAKSNADAIGASIEFTSTPDIGTEFNLILTK